MPLLALNLVPIVYIEDGFSAPCFPCQQQRQSPHECSQLLTPVDRYARPWSCPGWSTQTLRTRHRISLIKSNQNLAWWYMASVVKISTCRASTTPNVSQGISTPTQHQTKSIPGKIHQVVSLDTEKHVRCRRIPNVRDRREETNNPAVALLTPVSSTMSAPESHAHKPT